MNKKEKEELNEMLGAVIKKLSEALILKLKFKIHIESEGEGCKVEIEGNKPSLMTALAELSGALVENSNLTEKDILFAINTGIKNSKKED